MILPRLSRQSFSPHIYNLRAGLRLGILGLSISLAWVPLWAAPDRDWRLKVEPALLQELMELERSGDATAPGPSHGSVGPEFLVYLREQADLGAAAALGSKEAKGAWVSRTLRELARRTQEPVLDELAALGVEHRPYWIANMVWARGGAEVVEALARRDDVSYVYNNPWTPMEEPIPVEGAFPWKSTAAIEWNLVKVDAPTVWAQGIFGGGAVVGGQDTGYDWDHPALRDQYRGWGGASADHDYNWHDAIHSGGGICGPDSPQPCDDNSHGTHTMGTMVGDDGGTNQIGMAPGARWIGCRNMDRGNGTPATYSECFQWFVAPTDLNDQNPDPSKAPHVINNSWSCPPSEGCTDPEILRKVVENVRAAGIVVVVSAGNSGSGCGTVQTPAAIYDASFSVGATTSSDNISSFSSRGPVTADGSGRLKPDISAPGSGIRSSFPNGGYGSSSGTSMAAPHVAGLVALMISANPELAGDVDRIEALLRQSAAPMTSAQTCGGIPGSQIPNNTFGHGRIDAAAAVAAAGGRLFSDGFESGDATAWTSSVLEPKTAD